MTEYSDRHPATAQIMRWFAADHLPEGLIRETSAMCRDLAEDMVRDLPDGPELSAGLRKLLEAKDAFVRQAVDAVKTAKSATVTPPPISSGAQVGSPE